MKKPTRARRGRTITAGVLRSMPLPHYGDGAHKADRGKLLVVAGSRRLPGPAILVATAALRTGCGTVRVATPAGVAVPVGIACPELMVLPLPETGAGTAAPAGRPEIEAQYQACAAGVVGPGLDDEEGTNRLLRELVADAPLPLLVDASALLAYAAAPGALRGARVFTPHAAEMAALAGTDVAAVEREREEVALTFAQERGAVLVLKGQETLVAGPDGRLYRNTAGTRGLGTAGSGDALAGIIGALLAQRMEPVAAAVWGVHLHALAGEAAARDLGEDGLLIRDVIERLPRAIRELRRQTQA